MINRIEWEESDIICGRYICCNSWSENSEDISGLCSVTYKLGYIGGSSECMCLVSIADGLIIRYKRTEEKNAKQVLMEDLNKHTLGYRLLTHAEIARRIEYLHTDG